MVEFALRIPSAAIRRHDPPSEDSDRPLLAVVVDESEQEQAARLHPR